MIAVLVAVAIAIAALARVSAVQDQDHVPELLPVVVCLQHRQHVTLQQPGAHHEQRAVHDPVDDLRVRDHLHGRTVDENVVVLRPQRLDELSEARFGQQLGGIRGHGAHGQHEEAVGTADRHYQPRHVVAAPREVVADSPGGRAGVDRKRSLAQVAVDHQHLLALEREAGRRVRGQEGLAAAHVERGEQADVAVPGALSRLHDELEVGAQHPEGLVDHVAAALAYHYLAAVLLGELLPAGARKAREPAPHAAGHRQRDLAGERQGQVFEVLAAAHPGVHALKQVDRRHGNQQAEDEGHHQNLALVGGGRYHGAHRGRDHPGVVGREGLRELVLLAFLEQEEVERLLDLLLALHGEQVSALARVLGYALGGPALAVLEGVDLGVQGLDMVVDGGDDGPAHGLERLVHVHHEGVGLAAVGHEVVALELEAVVVGDLLLYAGALYAGVGGQQLVLPGVAGEVVAHVARHRQLGAELEYAGAGLAALAHVHACRGLHVGKQVLALVGRDVLVHDAQLMLYHREALVDEHRGAHGYLVLVLDPVFVVDGYQRVEHVLGPLGAHVVDGEVDDRGLVVVEPDHEVLRICGRGRLDAALAHADHTLEGFVGGNRGAHDADAAYRGRSERIVARGHAAGDLLAVERELAEAQSAVVIGADRERGSGVVAEVLEDHLEGPGGTVEHLVMEAALGAVAYVQLKPPDHVHHHCGRLQRLHLVVDVGVGPEEAEVAHHSRGVAEGAASAAILLYEERGRAGIDRRGPENVDRGNTEHQHHRYCEPPPSAEAQVEEVLETERVLGALELLEEEIVIVVCHFCHRFNDTADCLSGLRVCW